MTTHVHGVAMQAWNNVRARTLHMLEPSSARTGIRPDGSDQSDGVTSTLQRALCQPGSGPISVLSMTVYLNAKPPVFGR